MPGPRTKDPGSPEGAPEFFKVYLPSFSLQRLRIPPAFIKHFNGIIPNKLTLNGLAGKYFHVDVEQDENGVFVTKGWQCFAHENCIKVGDFLVFRYDGKFIFDVRIFGKNGCKKEAPIVAEEPITHVKEEEGTKKEEQISCSEHMHSCKHKSSKINQGIKILGPSNLHEYRSKRIASMNEEIQRIFKATKSVLPKNPLFLGSLKMKYNLNIPRQFVVGNGIKLLQNIGIRNHKGELWPVKVKFRSDGRIAFGTGWVNFLKDNELGVNDKCVFEFVVRKEKFCREVRAHVFRSGERSRVQWKPKKGH